jgi:apolipoprotein N-acyltransferase
MTKPSFPPFTKQFLSLSSNPLFQLGLAFASGIGMALAAAPINAWGLAWITMVPLWMAVVGSGSGGQGSGKTRSLHPHSPLPTPYSPIPFALLWGIGYHSTALSWITGLHPLMWLGIPWLGSVAIVLFCWAFITLWGAALVVIWAWILRRLSQFKIQNSKFKIILAGTALWCGLEWLWSFTPLYWTSLSFTQSPGNLLILHLGQLSGPSVVTAAIVAINGLLALAGLQIIQNPKSKIQNSFALLSAIALFLVLHTVGFVLYSQPLNQSLDTALKVGIVQGNVPTRIKLSTQGIRRAIDGYIAGYEALANQGVQAVLTPEGALPIFWEADRNPFRQAVLRKGVAAWLGIFVQQERQITQSLLALAGNGDVVGRYNKIKLVPLGEYIPFQEVLGAIINRLSPIESSMVPGTSAQRFDTPFGRAIASICYESAFPELFRTQAAAGGQFILTASNLDPYSEVLMAQHQAQDLMRAIETDRWAARATNTGYSGIIDPHGQILWRSQPHSDETHAETIYRRQTQTLYVRWGDWITPLLLGLAAIVMVFSPRGDRRAGSI